MDDDTRTLEPPTPAAGTQQVGHHPGASDTGGAPGPDGTTTYGEPGPRLRDRLAGWRGLAAVAVASLNLGGGGGVLLGVLSNGADAQQRGPGGRNGQFQPGQLPGQLPGGSRGQQGGQQGGFQPGQLPGGSRGQQGVTPPGAQLPPGTTPRNDVVPDGQTDGGAGTGQNT